MTRSRPRAAPNRLRSRRPPRQPARRPVPNRPRSRARRCSLADATRSRPSGKLCFRFETIATAAGSGPCVAYRCDLKRRWTAPDAGSCDGRSCREVGGWGGAGATGSRVRGATGRLWRSCRAARACSRRGAAVDGVAAPAVRVGASSHGPVRSAERQPSPCAPARTEAASSASPSRARRRGAIDASRSGPRLGAGVVRPL
jgi:hypothetical protein